MKREQVGLNAQGWKEDTQAKGTGHAKSWRQSVPAALSAFIFGAPGARMGALIL